MGHIKEINEKFCSRISDEMNKKEAFVVLVIGVTKQGHPVTMNPAGITKEELINLLELQLDKFKTEQPIKEIINH